MSMHTEHQIQTFKDENAVKIVGKYRGQPYGAKINLNDGTAEWDSEVKHLTPPGTETPGEAKGSPCPGCGKGLVKLIRGGWGWAKAALTKSPDDETVLARKQMCLHCPSNCYDFGVCRDDWEDGRKKEEQGCGCVLSLKILVKSEECPHGHWEAVD